QDKGGAVAALYRVPVTGGTSTLLMRQPGAWIGKISADPASQDLVFSRIAPVEQPGQPSSATVQLMYMPFSGAANPIGQGGQPAFSNAAAFTAVAAQPAVVAVVTPTIAA